MPLSVTLKVPLKAGGCLPQPSADTTPLAPCGTLALASLRCTDGAASTFALAAASCCAGDCCVAAGAPPPGSLEQDATVTTHSAERAAAASFREMRMGVRLTEEHVRSRRPGASAPDRAGSRGITRHHAQPPGRCGYG